MKTEQANDSPLLQAIREQIEMQPGRAISFRDYMDLCLYHPSLGYYMNSNRKIGRAGDFYTSASVGSVLGDMLAAYLRSFAETRSGDICLTEWGGGDGTLARQMLDAIRSGSPALYARLRFISIEKSPVHRSLQSEALAPHMGACELPHSRGVARGRPLAQYACFVQRAAGRLSGVPDRKP
ncbi:SAM-dependent methyltransferase [Paenibacillus elgii]|uniref:SAM-dependent methyltransferase n=1 Tax=Paenibacillus elgii TaxID=189691 RepID=UPI0021D52EAD|nr:SAM-dependent methyltransferase [Paenibacillus elgii]